MTNKKVEVVEIIEPAKFTKEQLLSSFRFKHKADLLNALFQKGESYTLDEADALIEEYLKGEVK